MIYIHFSPRSRKFLYPRKAQRGAVLYVALIMLILLALIGISAMQVAGMQEKMASNYRVVNRSFQLAEGVVRNAEASVEAISNRTTLPDGSVVSSGSIQRGCDDGFDPVQWGQQQSSYQSTNVRQIDQCIQGEANIGMGQPLDSASPVFQITGSSMDDRTNGSSKSVVDTVFKL
ncbi:type IV pilus assembly protein PilX [Xanthomonas arboricola]|uniref:pilus assembly PilX family protein n=1 Tax=Xanthomonas sp. 3793 TaxID=3035312 RepID=UPI002167CB55|nr:PilX N-terminal domain-containing pilus assembly protein [Xanthomonas sp. 3793]MCS3745082.1 type IV pilus assembly protein PilX [Xanthomonas sp. 3793]